ncbi:hypothetical protein VTK73DRAFT_1457 [Phialemonium thermophilum]|uniref:GST N-terminal domain-containing protein n=1 Tax=Phialemonium thermophilum TaxID=223376 RepID=A0ABR3VTF7_9PEZI
MSSEPITLFDFASKPPCTAWNRHSLKTRLVLNYKGLDYKTEWQTEYPDIQRKFQPQCVSLPSRKRSTQLTRARSLPPNEQGVPYTMPVVRLGDGTWIKDSAQIARALEARHPSPPLHLDSPYRARAEQLAGQITKAVVPLCYARIPVSILNEPSVEYWYTTRRQRLGMTVDEYEKTAGAAAYANAEPHLQQMTELLREKEGPFVLGSEVSYADFEWVAVLEFFRRVDEGVFEEVLKRTGDEAVHRALLEACAPWLKRNDH